MRQKEKKSKKPAIALMLCFCLMALVSIFTVKASIDKVQNSMETADVVKKQQVEEPSKSESEVVDSLDSTDQSSSQAGTSSEYIFPVKGEIIMEYSMDMPIYWKTLDQYMTHNGIDIAAETGTPVQATAGGTVTKIETDDAMGITVQINHGNGLISTYSNLASDGLIELGEIVEQGAVIGKVGQSSMFEFESPAHLHFSLEKNGEAVDPRNYITPRS